MSLTVKLRKEAAKYVEEAKKIQAKAVAEGRALDKDEEKKVETLLLDARLALDNAKKQETLEQLDAELAAAGMSADDEEEEEAPEEETEEEEEAPSESTATHRRRVPPGRLRNRIYAVARDRVKEGRKGFSHMGEFAASVYRACIPGAQQTFDPRLKPLMAATGGSQGVPSEGGFTVPPTFQNTIWDGLNQAPDNLLGMTDQYTITGESLSFPANAETSRTNGLLYGGVQANWLAEAGQITNTKPKFRRIKLEPQELAVLIYVTDKLLRNSTVALEQYLSRAASEAIIFKVGDAIINGDGSGKPLGLLNSSSLVTVAKESGQAADTVLLNNLVKMYARMHARRRGNAVWLINQDIEPQLWNLTQEGTSSSTPVFLPAGAGMFGGAAGAPLATLLGRPIVPTEHCQTLGDVGDIILADLSAYATGVRGDGIRTAMSIHLRFDYAETAFRFMFEVDGKPWLLSALTPANSSNTQSTHVALAARA